MFQVTMSSVYPDMTRRLGLIREDTMSNVYPDMARRLGLIRVTLMNPVLVPGP